MSAKRDGIFSRGTSYDLILGYFTARIPKSGSLLHYLPTHRPGVRLVRLPEAFRFIDRLSSRDSVGARRHDLGLGPTFRIEIVLYFSRARSTIP